MVSPYRFVREKVHEDGYVHGVHVDVYGPGTGTGIGTGTGLELALALELEPVHEHDEHELEHGLECESGFELVDEKSHQKNLQMGQS